ncbi:MAG: hypothetical protein IKU29_05190, partial [Parabacteroides sp.]|nr:hypothetical protein [Parabacteroides sp.]
MDIENSYNDIQSIQEDWQLDERNGLPYSGQSVQRFIKEMLNSKVQASYFDPSTYILYSFRNEEDKLNWLETQDNQLVLSQTPFTFTGVINQLKVVNGMDSTNLYYITTTPEAVIKMSFVSQQKGLTDTVWEEILEDFNVTVSVDKGYTGSFTNILENQLVLNGKEFSVDVKKYIVNGSNRVRISVEGVTTGTTTSIIYNVTLTSMYLEASNFGWHVPFVEGTTYNLGGMLIGGSLNKVLNIRVTGYDYDKSYQVNLGTSTYTTNSYYFTGMEFPGQTGVYCVECWLDANGLESDHLRYDIMCVSSTEILTAKLLVINEVSDVVTNFTDNILYKYSCYNGGSSIASPKVLIKANNQTLIDETLIDVTAMSKQSYVTNLEIESEDTSMILFAEMEYGTKAEAHMNIDNSASYPATSGASFYLNASSRNNSQENYDKIVNQTNGTEYDVDWSRMAWTEKSDGWVLDDTGRKSLYVPAGSKADISYQPLKDIGTGKTIEFLFKASNVSDSNEPIITICDNPTSPKFKGIRITPSRITVHSRDLNTADSIQGYTLEEDKVMHVIVTIVRNYKTTYGNFCLVYVNGVKKCTFAFENTDNWNVNSNLILGSETADLFMYKMRTYEVGFGMQDAMDNFVSSLPSAVEKKAAMDEIESVI